MRRHLRRLSRALRLAVWLAAAWLEVGLAQWRGRRVSPARRQRAYRRLARILALRISLHGTCPPAPTLLVANHISWLDVIAIGACSPTSFIAKADVRGWPVLGRMASHLDTLFLRREVQRDAAHAVFQAGSRLGQGHTLTLFPEGTTTRGERLAPFRAALLHAAVIAEVPLTPVALRYLDGRGERDRLAPFVDDDSLLPHLWQLLGRERTHVEVAFLPAIRVAHRKQAAGAAHQAIADWLSGAPRQPWPVPAWRRWASARRAGSRAARG
ncbi:MAG TPA: lysophospholipid acyltransferase family protein [Gammaproteobacteria bacterium]|nr:lysophospholipid acyltransferase family protein [Gammaproteobacteria bacterium]